MFFRFNNSSPIFSGFLLLGFAYASQSCEQILDVNQGDRQTHLLITAIVGSDSLPNIYFTESLDFEVWMEQEREVLFPTDLAPIIKVGSETYPLLLHTDVFARPCYRPQKLLPDRGNYRLELVYKGDSLYANAKAPSKPNPDFDYEFRIVNDPISNDPFNKIRLTFSDSSSSSQAYKIQYGYDAKFEANIFDSTTQSYYLDTLLSSSKQESESIIDRTGDGQKRFFDIWPIRGVIPQEEIQPDGSSRPYQLIWILLTSLSPDFYDYEIFTNQYFRHPLDDPFVEPLLTYSNIHNGQGIFAAYQTADTVWMKIYLD